jgi:hypothetical protein
VGGGLLYQLDMVTDPGGTVMDLPARQVLVPLSGLARVVK